MLNILKNTINRVFASGVDSDASAFITATGLSGTTQKSAITTLVKDLKSSGLWSKMKAVYPMVTDNYNLLSYTEDITNGLWNKYRMATTGDTTTAPNGTLTADTLSDTAVNDAHQLYAILSSMSPNTYTFSFYVKAKDSTRNLAIYPFTLSGAGGTGGGGVILTQTGSFVANIGSGVSSYNSVNVGNGWYRISVTGYTTATSELRPIIGFANGSNQTYLGDNTGVYIWGAQFETGSTATTYQPIATTPSAFMASQMKYNLKDARDLDAAFRLTWSGGWTYSATGATPNGTNAYADTYLIPSTSLTTSSAHFSKYNRTNDLVGNKIDGAISADSTKYMQQNYSAGNGIIGDLATLMAYTATDTRGLFTATRTSTSLSKVFRNSSQVTSSSVSITGLPNRSLYLGGRNDGVTSFYNSYQIAFSSIGDGLTDQDSLLLNQIVEKYQVALSRGVQAAQSFYYNSAYSNEANTYLYSTQITGTNQVSAINTLINGLKANNLWSKMKAVYPFVTDKTLQSDMAAQMKFNLVNPQDSDAAFRLAFSGGWTYSTNGAQPNGTNGYADTKFNLSTNFGTREQSYSLYTQASNSNANVLAGVTDGSSPTQFYNGTGQFNILSTLYAKGSSFSNGCILMTSTLSAISAFEKAIKIGTTSGSTYSAVNYNYYIGARNNAGTSDFFADRRYSFAHIGNTLTDAEAILFSQLIQQFQTDLSRQV